MSTLTIKQVANERVMHVVLEETGRTGKESLLQQKISAILDQAVDEAYSEGYMEGIDSERFWGRATGEYKFS